MPDFPIHSHIYIFIIIFTSKPADTLGFLTAFMSIGASKSMVMASKVIVNYNFWIKALARNHTAFITYEVIQLRLDTTRAITLLWNHIYTLNRPCFSESVVFLKPRGSFSIQIILVYGEPAGKP